MNEPSPNLPDVPSRLIDLAWEARLDAPPGSEITRMLRAVIPEIEKRVREQVAAEARRAADLYANNHPPLPGDAATLRSFADRIERVRTPRRLTEQDGGIPNDAYTAADHPKGM